MKKTITTNSVDETEALGVQFAQRLSSGMMVALNGDLGTGKTAFVKGVARGLNITRTINSPTFTLMKIYPGRLLLVHIDAYRLEGVTQDLGFEDYLDPEALAMIEWADFVRSSLPPFDLTITFTRTSDTQRMICFETDREDLETLL